MFSLKRFKFNTYVVNEPNSCLGLFQPWCICTEFDKPMFRLHWRLPTFILSVREWICNEFNNFILWNALCKSRHLLPIVLHIIFTEFNNSISSNKIFQCWKNIISTLKCVSQWNVNQTIRQVYSDGWTFTYAIHNLNFISWKICFQKKKKITSKWKR